MKISLSWLNDYVDLNGISTEEISKAVTFLGFEVEGVEKTGAPKLENVFVGEVLTREKHPNADKLSVCRVNVGDKGEKIIVCGAQNYKVGDRVPVALPGAVLPGDFVIKQASVRGQSSDGMMCSGRELGIGDDHSGLLILKGTPELGKAINEVLPAGDTVFDIEITPNRPDCLSHLGIARELGAWFKREVKYPEVSGHVAEGMLKTDTAKKGLLKGVRVEVPAECPLYTATAVAGVKIGESPDWMKERLTAAGMRPINNVVDIGNFVMLEYGQPVHAFDAVRLGGSELVIRHAKAGEKLLFLDGKERTFEETMLVIADATTALVAAGIMGGEASGISAATTDLVLEVAHFQRQGIRATSRKLGVGSDSSYRYERGVDVHSLEEARRRFVDLIVSLAGGEVAGEVIRVGGDKPWQREVVLEPAFVNERLGFEIPAEEMRVSLEALDFIITREEAGPKWTVSIPSWRDDVDRPIDLVEEILRLHGTDKIPTGTAKFPGLVKSSDAVVSFNRKATEMLAGASFCECVNYTLRPKEEVSAWVESEKLAGLALLNPFIEDQSHVRPTLIGGLLESLKLNLAHGVEAPRLFETGRIFLESRGSLCECVAVGFILHESEEASGWLKRGGADFYLAKNLVGGVAEAAGVEFGRQPMALVEGKGLGWQAGHAAVAGNINYGWVAQMGLLDLGLLKKHGIEGRVYAGLFAILPEKLETGGKERKRYQGFSLFPAALRDLALVVEEKVPASEVQKVIAKVARGAAGDKFALEGVKVFDVYRGKGVEEGKKSLAFSLVFRSAERTLTDEEVNAVFTEIVKGVEAAGYSVRK